jgi:hypothetical protein
MNLRECDCCGERVREDNLHHADVGTKNHRSTWDVCERCIFDKVPHLQNTDVPLLTLKFWFGARRMTEPLAIILVAIMVLAIFKCLEPQP